MIYHSVQSITDTTGKASEHWNLWCGHGCWWRGGDPATAAERTGRPWTDLCCPPGQCQHGVVPVVCVVHLHWAVLPIICIAECPFCLSARTLALAPRGLAMATSSKPKPVTVTSYGCHVCWCTDAPTPCSCPCSTPCHAADLLPRCCQTQVLCVVGKWLARG
jgi:hypothetical protein